MARLAATAMVLVSALGCGSEPDDDVGDGSSTGTGGGGSSGGATTIATTTGSDGSAPGSATVDSTAGAGSSDGGDTVGSDDGGTTDALPQGCYDYAAFAPTVVSFRADVMPIFASACSSCHADASKSIYFGQGGTTEAEATAVYDVLLHGVPKQAPQLAFVAPFDPLHSYMIAKIEYADPGHTCAAVQCDEPGCELAAPPAGPLPEADKATLRSWVLGGALDD
ncbi:MAG: hypothetical protein K1X88_23885 [Nannocystaceae bacterium]|nr:hypothetical protein [Nannocystaceae bacterium]